jgi:beta-lactamase superfamily II metal-dependent hydrolase
VGGAARPGGRAPDGTEGWVASELVVEPRHLRRYEVGGELRYAAPVYATETGRKVLYELLWGDRVQVLDAGEHRSRVRARGAAGWVSNEALGDESLLEVYFIDVGQGDGVLIRTPDDRHILLDGGYARSRQPTGKSAADFVDWKFFDDYGDFRIRLDAMIASHCDADHYGGLWDLVSDDPAARDELDTAGTDIDAFYHAGVSWWTPGDRTLGPVVDGHLIQLLGDRDSVLAALQPDADPELQGWWADFLEELVRVAPVVQRLGVPEGSDDVYLPGFGTEDDSPRVRVLGPVTRTIQGRPAVPRLAGGDAQNTNGHSVLLRLDHGRARILLTGDLNKRSMRLLLVAYEDRAHELACDVAKACHHGSEDISYAFLQAMRPAATVISSGDNEGHGHPRPIVAAASAVAGHVEIDTTADELLTPLVYSTEIERSVRLGRIHRIEALDYPHDGEALHVRVYARASDDVENRFREDAEAKRDVRSWVHYGETRPGALRPERGFREFPGSYVVSGMVYGLVNVRTDGETILCATRNEADARWSLRTFTSRF